MIKQGVYRHFKNGKQYRVIGTAVHSETLEPMVVYEAQYDNPVSKLWVRPEAMFIEVVELDGKKVARFQFEKEL